VHLRDHGLALVGLAVAGDERDLDGEYTVIHALDLEPDGIGISGAGIYRRPRLLDLLARDHEAQGLAGPLRGLHGRLQFRVEREVLRVAPQEGGFRGSHSELVGHLLMDHRRQGGVPRFDTDDRLAVGLVDGRDRDGDLVAVRAVGHEFAAKLIVPVAVDGQVEALDTAHGGVPGVRRRFAVLALDRVQPGAPVAAAGRRLTFVTRTRGDQRHDSRYCNESLHTHTSLLEN